MEHRFEVECIVRDMLEGHEEEMPNIILALKVNGFEPELEYRPAPYADIINSIERVLDASGLDLAEIDLILNRIYCSSVDH